MWGGVLVTPSLHHKTCVPAGPSCIRNVLYINKRLAYRFQTTRQKLAAHDFLLRLTSRDRKPSARPV